MRLLIAFSLFLVTFCAFSQSIVSTQIHDIDMGQVGEEPLIFLASCQVVTYPSSNKALMDKFREAILKKTWFEFTLNDERQITDFKEIASPPATVTFKSMSLHNQAPYSPSILKDMDVARRFFYEARRTHKLETQCFNRAHVWSFEWRKKNNLYSSKVWLFFTRRFIRKYQFEWWFHVAPMVHVVIDGSVRERVMDIKYSQGPRKLKQWTDTFMRDSANCPVVEKYSDHANYPESGSCFVMKSSMYYYQPVDLEQQEQIQTVKSRWIEAEVKNAYLEAFDEHI